VITILACASFPIDTPSGLHELARAFHGGDPDVLEAVTAIVVDGLRRGAAGDHLTMPAAVVVVPGHAPASVNGPCLALARRLVDTLGWPAPSQGVLARIAPAPEGRTATGRIPGDETVTLRWHAELLPAAGSIVLLDDVVRSGATLMAASLAAPVRLRERLVPLAVFRAG
jgi:hypothetical protein